MRLEIRCGTWRALFGVEGPNGNAIALGAAYPPRFLNDPKLDDLPDRAASPAFLARWPGSEPAPPL
ncbi:MAG TPA: hypothetical protein VMB21_13365 [Candidatus Limnocylindria bacterium]|nr:hypothetical protein [Candidatus Limnocylindria bacterium]